MKVTGETFSFH